MTKHLQGWIALSLTLGAGLVGLGVYLDTQIRDSPIDQGTELVKFAGVALLLLVGMVWLCRRQLSAVLESGAVDTAGIGSRLSRHPVWTLFLVSFIGLFVEIMLIRYSGSQIRIFSFYKNVPLIAAYLGLGLGCWLGGGRARHALGFLLWLVPLALFLSMGSIAIRDYLGLLAAAGSSEHILGDAVVKTPGGPAVLMSQLYMALFCVGVLVAITLIFLLIGRLLGEAFEHLPRLQAYTTNILGSLAGILAFLLLSYLETPPWVWFPVGLVALLWWLDTKRQRITGIVLIAIATLSVAPDVGDTVWSRYQKLVGHHIETWPIGSDSGSNAYLVDISDVFYQVAVDLRPESVARMGTNPFPHYDDAMTVLPPKARVLIVGAGTGNDAAALRAGAARVDAVDIDPAIVVMGRRHHPEQPYRDLRVHLIIDDARSAFRHMPKESFDAVVFGLLDSHTQLGMSSVRLDNYVFTLESLETARTLLKPGGHIILTAATFRPWFGQRFHQMLTAISDTPVVVSRNGIWSTYVCSVTRPSQPPSQEVPDAVRAQLPSDDWPFLYLPSKSIPRAYVIAVVLMAAASVMVLRSRGLRAGNFDAFHGHMFFLGAAFLLMEVYAINRLALLFGTTWLVSAVTIGLVLILIVLANFTVMLLPFVSQKVAYPGLILALLASYALDPSHVVGAASGTSILYGLLLLLPVYFAGIVFARSFRMAKRAGPAIGANMFGAVLGGWVEYSSMAVGFRALALLALSFYVLSLLMYVRHSVLSNRVTRTV
jgi:hypothetical protein